MAELRISPTEAFTFSRPEEWTKWIRRFERFQQASSLAEKEQVSQIHTLIHTVGDSEGDILSSFRLTEEQGKSYTTVVEKFEGHFVKRRNLIFERAKFNQQKQEEGEPVDDFIMDLYRLAEHCSYGNHDELIRDRIVVGLCSAALSEKLQRDADLTLDKAVRMAREDETIRKQQALLRNDFKEDKPEQGKDKLDLDYLRKKPFKHRREPPSATPPGQQQQNPKKCTRCGRSPAHSREQCPATCHSATRKAISSRCAVPRESKPLMRRTQKPSLG